MVISRLKESIIKALLEKWLIVIPIPIVDKRIDSMAYSSLDLHFHNEGISLVQPEVAMQTPTLPVALE